MKEIKHYIKNNEMKGYVNKFYSDSFFNIYATELNESRYKDQIFEGISFKYGKNSFTISFEEKDGITAYLVSCFHFLEEEVFINNENFEMLMTLDNLKQFLNKLQKHNIIKLENLREDVFAQITSSLYHIEDENNINERNIGMSLEKWDRRK